jgi:hypothetical protein
MVTKLKGKKVNQMVSEKLVIVCSECRVQCFYIIMKKKSDGNFWSDDTCHKCGAKLPVVRIKNKKEE